MLPILPENAPFSPEQRAWLNGFLAGIFNDRLAEAGASAAARASEGPKAPLLVLFGSQTGTAEGLAKKLAKEAERRGYAPRVMPWNDYAKAELAQQSILVVITSTWGDGDAPDNAAAGLAWLSSEQAADLSRLQYAVLGLGDRNYSEFCGAAKKFDVQLSARGAKRLVPTGECDVDYEYTAQEWIARFWESLPNLESTGSAKAAVRGPGAPQPAEVVSLEKPTASYHRQNPFPTRLKTNRRLNHPDSTKDTRHLEILLNHPDLTYEAGDALGVTPSNCPVLVEEFLAAAGLLGDETVEISGIGSVSLHDALLRWLNITQPTRELLEHVAKRTNHPVLEGLLQPERKRELDSWLYGRDIVDVLRSGPKASWQAQELVGWLRRMQARLYSISSSPKAHPGEVHVTVGAVRYDAHGRTKKGVASCWLADRVVPGQTEVPVFIQTSHGFRLPSQGATPVIMVGPGTGIAPFRSFLEERVATGASGRNWLFFGDQRRSHDFLYEDQILNWQNSGVLSRLDLAFSRDQAEKVYVQHRMIEGAAELWRWLEEGAHFYVCGDAKRMAKDVDEALHRVVQQMGGKTEDGAREYVAGMKSAKRYQRDVY
ncbi:MAG: sulfite reductase subunit alpha [Verrucomicrobiales bacterium]|nr:sulfite reductase subunit alpha [Verrucomicrobiales bacterium]